jgi:hypothetical protein
VKGGIMRRTTGAMCAFAVFVVQAALQPSYADTATATFSWINRTRFPMRVEYSSSNDCVVSYSADVLALNPGDVQSLEVTYQRRCDDLTMAWNISGGGSRLPFSGTLTYYIEYATPNLAARASVRIVYTAGKKLKGAKFRITCGTRRVDNCYQEKGNKAPAIIGPGASIELLSNGWWGRELFGGTSTRGCYTC